MLSGFSVETFASVSRIIERYSVESRSGRHWASSDYEVDERIGFYEACQNHGSKSSPGYFVDFVTSVEW
jgi:hypothetical protein